MEQAETRSLQKTIEAMKVLVVDDEQYMRKVVRTMLLSMGAKTIYEAEAAKLGAHEYLLKPVSTKALLERIAAILTIPRPFITLDGYYGPAPRTLFNRDQARPASAQKPARPPKDAQPGDKRPVAASRSLPARQPARIDRDEVVGKKVVLL